MTPTPSIGAAFPMAIVAATSMIAAQVAGRASRDALFLNYFEASDLPAVMIGAALVSIGSAFTLSRWLATSSPARAIPIAYAGSSVLLVGIFALVRAMPELGAIAIYLHVAAFGALLISGFWSVVNERFDPYTAKRVVPRIAAAAAAGGVLGGLLVERFSSYFGLATTLTLMAALHGVCALCIWQVGAGTTASQRSTLEEGGASGLQMLRRTKFLQQMAGVVALSALLDALLDYALKAEAQRALSDGESLIRFFALFYTAVGLVTFLLQLSAGKWVLRRYGLAGAMGVFPFVVLSGGVFAAALTRLWTLVIVRGGAAVVTNSLFRAGFELLYTPVPAHVKRPAKIFVDVGAMRVGDIAGAGLIMMLLLVPLETVPLIASTAAVVSVGLFLSIRRLQSGYVDQLASSLRSGVLQLDEAAVVEATTARTLAASQVAIDRRALLAQIELEHQKQQARDAASATQHEPLATAAHALRETSAEIPLDDAARATRERVAALYSTTPATVMAVLGERPGDPKIVPHVVRLLDVPLVAEYAMRFLRRVEPSAVGSIVDALVDPLQPYPIQRRLARVLEASRDPRALAGIDRLLGRGEISPGSDADDRFDLRYACAQSGVRIVAHSPALALPLERVIELVARELEVDEDTWKRQGRRNPGVPNRSALLDGNALRRIPRNVEHVFTLLALSLDRRVMASMLAGLYSDDAHLRGTALEYLEVALPAELRHAMQARLEPLREREASAIRSERHEGELAQTLLESASAIPLGRDFEER